MEERREAGPAKVLAFDAGEALGESQTAGPPPPASVPETLEGLAGQVVKAEPCLGQQYVLFGNVWKVHGRGPRRLVLKLVHPRDFAPGLRPQDDAGLREGLKKSLSWLARALNLMRCALEAAGGGAEAERALKVLGEQLADLERDIGTGEG